MRLITLLLCAVSLCAQTTTFVSKGRATGSDLACDGVQQTNLAACWKFDEGSGQTLTDYFNTNDGQLGPTAGSDSEDPTWASTGLEFDDSNDYVTVPNILNPNTDFTLMVVFRKDSNDVTLFHQQDGTGTGRGWLYVDASGNLETFLGNTATEYTSAISNGTWHVGTVRHNSGTISVILDTNTPSSASVTVESATGAHIIGIHKALSLQPFDGGMAWAILYSAALSDSAVNQQVGRLLALVADRGI